MNKKKSANQKTHLPNFNYNTEALKHAYKKALLSNTIAELCGNTKIPLSTFSSWSGQCRSTPPPLNIVMSICKASETPIESVVGGGFPLYEAEQFIKAFNKTDVPSGTKITIIKQ
jgi:hypothetical protein